MYFEDESMKARDYWNGVTEIIKCNKGLKSFSSISRTINDLHYNIPEAEFPGLVDAVERHNHTIQSIHFDSSDADGQKFDRIQGMLDLNRFGLKPFRNSPSSSATTRYDAESSNYPYTKGDFLAALVRSVELEARDSAGDETADTHLEHSLLSSLFRLFQANPVLVDYVGEEWGQTMKNG